MKQLVLVIAAAFATVASAQQPTQDVARWEKQAKGITITRDNWGIAHVRGKTDADAVFGLMYAQGNGVPQVNKK